MRRFWGGLVLGWMLCIVCIASALAMPESAMDGVDTSSFVFARTGEKTEAAPGVPVIFTKNKAEEDKFIPLAPTWRPEIPDVQISSFGGMLLQVPYVTHIPSLSIYVQVLPDKSVVVTERLTLVLTQADNGPFIRSYPTAFKNAAGASETRGLSFIRALYNGREIAPKMRLQGTEQQLVFFEGEGLPSGIHLFEITYEVPDGVIQKGNVARLFVPLLGDMTRHAVQNMQVFVVYPEKSKLAKADILFGKNNEKVPEAYDAYLNENNHLIFKIKGILPPYADVRMDVVSDTQGFVPDTPREKFNARLSYFSWLIVTLLTMFVVFMYFLFTATDTRDKVENKKYLHWVRSRMSYDADVLRWVEFRKADMKTVLAAVVHLIQKGLITVSFDANGDIILNRMKKQSRATGHEKEVMRFLFPRFRKVRSLRKWHWTPRTFKKVQRFARLGLRQQIARLIVRETVVGMALAVLGVLIIIYLQPGIEKVFIGSALIFVAYWLSLIHFVKRARIMALVRQIFKEYAALLLTPEKRREVDIALDIGDRTMDCGLPIEKDGQKICVKAFERMFLNNLKYEGEKK